MIGEVRNILMQFYDRATNRMRFKNRPALVIAKADSEDYVILPISTVKDASKRNPTYDIQVEPSRYPLLGLSKVSYIRTHKQTTVHIAEIGSQVGDMKVNYEELYLLVLERREQFSAFVTDQALS